MVYSTALTPPSERASLEEPLLTTSQERVSQASTSIFKDLAISISRSKLIKPILATVITLSLLTALTTPPMWLIIAATVSSFAIPLILQFSGKGWQQFTFELTALARLCKNKNYHKIFTHPEKQASIFLGALPNSLRSDGEKLKREKISAVVSVNESWEREARGLSLPYTEQKWKQLNIEYKPFQAIDHIPLSLETLHDTADQIRSWIQEGRNIYVHCRAGVGRSAMAVAAYLIKYEHMSVDEAVSQIVSNRPRATLEKPAKKARLNEFHQECSVRT